MTDHLPYTPDPDTGYTSASAHAPAHRDDDRVYDEMPAPTGRTPSLGRAFLATGGGTGHVVVMNADSARAAHPEGTMPLSTCATGTAKRGPISSELHGARMNSSLTRGVSTACHHPDEDTDDENPVSGHVSHPGHHVPYEVKALPDTRERPRPEGG